jgi:hypothetical protein
MAPARLHRTGDGNWEMPRVQTHYDNLKVSRDAPIEVIRAAYRSLSVKYHPDRHPDSDKAARIMRIINASYEVLSDPAKRLQHDRWIASMESDTFEAAPPVAPEPPPRKRPASEPATTRQPVPEPKLLAAETWRGRYLLKLVVGFFVVLIVGLSMLPSSSTSNRGGSGAGSVPTPVLTQVQAREQPQAGNPAAASVDEFMTQPTPSPAQAPLRPPGYSRPPLAPNGQSWPVESAYLGGYKRASTAGRSNVTVDNRQNSSDMLVKLFDRRFERPTAVRVFLLKAREQFKVEKVTPGNYDIRYQELDSGVIWRSEPFNLKEHQEEISEPGGTRRRTSSTVYTLTLYAVWDGNTHSEIIGPDEF